MSDDQIYGFELAETGLVTKLWDAKVQFHHMNIYGNEL